MEESKALSKLTEALSKAQSIIQGAIKDSENPYFKASYADLASVWEACRKPLTDNGLAVIQITKMIEGKLYLETILSHISGESISGIYPINPMRQKQGEGWTASEDPQSLGSALTYARRYTLAAIAGIAPEDDDGEGAVGRGIETKNKLKKETKGIRKDSSDQPPPASSTFEEYQNRMHDIKSIFELQNWWKKHGADIKLLPAVEFNELVAYKDHLKSQFAEEKK